MKNYLILILSFAILSCEKNQNDSLNYNGSPTKGAWSVSLDDLVLTENAHDKIPSIDHPEFTSWEQISLSGDEIVFVYKYQDISKVYPISTLTAHEIVNDQISDKFYCLTYCPLTGTPIAWNRKINGETIEFGVSGHLYKDNLIAYDRKTESYWSQILLKSIKGKLRDSKLERLPLIAMQANLARTVFKDALILANDPTCDSICYTKNFKNSYTLNDIAIIPNNYNPKTKIKVFHQSDFAGNNIISHQMANNFIIIGGNNPFFRAAFHTDYSYGFEFVLQNGEIHFKDKNNLIYKLSGELVEGSDYGQSLELANSLIARPFVWEDFFSDNQ
jgi:hypothetical protein